MNFSAFFTIFITETLGSVAFFKKESISFEMVNILIVSLTTYFYMKLVVHDNNKCSFMKQSQISGILHMITTTMGFLLAE